MLRATNSESYDANATEFALRRLSVVATSHTPRSRPAATVPAQTRKPGCRSGRTQPQRFVFGLTGAMGPCLLAHTLGCRRRIYKEQEPQLRSCVDPRLLPRQLKQRRSMCLCEEGLALADS